MWWTILLCTGGGFLGIGILGQIFAWITDRPNPVWDVCSTVLEILVDVLSGIDFDD